MAAKTNDWFSKLPPEKQMEYCSRLAGKKKSKYCTIDGKPKVMNSSAQSQEAPKQEPKPKKKPKDNSLAILEAKLKDKVLPKEIENLKNSDDAVRFAREVLGVTPNPDYRSDSGVWFSKDERQISMGIQVDRYSRHDHGGGDDGDDWLPDHEIQREHDAGVRQHQSKLELVKAALNKLGVDHDVDFDLGEKGHFNLEITIPTGNSWLSKMKSLTPDELKKIKIKTETGNEYANVQFNSETGAYMVDGYEGRQLRLEPRRSYELLVA